MRVFFQDINIGFITSTGSIKSTAFIFLQKNYLNSMHKKKAVQQFDKISMKMQLNFFNPAELCQVKPVPITTFRQAFIRNRKFESEFIILQEEENTDKMKKIFIVYKPSDDQIYLIKQSRLEGKQLTDIFNEDEDDENEDKHKICEARILAKLTHPNILKQYDWWIEQTNESSYIYMQVEYCSFPGYGYQPKNLLKFSYYYLNPVIASEKLKLIKEIIHQVLNGLEYIHQRDISQRDLKLENLHVTINIKGEIQVMLADFDHRKGLMDERKRKSYEITENKDEFRAIGVMILHLVLTIPGDPKDRNNYVKKFLDNEFDDVFVDFENMAIKLVRNRHPDFSFIHFKHIMLLAKKLTSFKIANFQQLRNELSDSLNQSN